jgi:hypothetical protein
MLTRKAILESLAKDTEDNLEEISVGDVAKVAVAGGVIGWALKQFKLPPVSKWGSRVSAIDYAKALAKATDNKLAVSAILGLLNICNQVLVRIPELRPISQKLTMVINSDAFEDYLD